MLAARRQMQAKAIDLEQTLRGLLRGFGMKLGDVSRGKFAARIRELTAGHEMLTKITEPMLSARDAIWREFAKLHREVLAFVKTHETCRLLMTAPGVGAVVSLTFRAINVGCVQHGEHDRPFKGTSLNYPHASRFRLR